MAARNLMADWRYFFIHTSERNMAQGGIMNSRHIHNWKQGKNAQTLKAFPDCGHLKGQELTLPFWQSDSLVRMLMSISCVSVSSE